MPADDSMLSNSTVEFREEERRFHAAEVGDRFDDFTPDYEDDDPEEDDR